MATATILTPQRVDELITIYREGLLDDVIPFWIKHSVDDEYGGYMFCVDRDGSRIDTDKGVWQQGRFAWMLATLYNSVEPRPEWLALAKHGLDFLRRYGFDSDGRMFFHLTRDGRPVRKRRYFFSEALYDRCRCRLCGGHRRRTGARRGPGRLWPRGALYHHAGAAPAQVQH